MQKAKELVDKVIHPHEETTASHSTNAGPHNSNVANKVDPRVDSDRDGRYGQQYATEGQTHRTEGPHNSDLLNKADPRVDSDRDGSRNYGAASHAPGGTYAGSGTTGHTGPAHLTGGTHTGTHGTHTGAGGLGTGPTHSGPHTTHTANALDPRVDTGLGGSHSLGSSGYTGTGTGYDGTSHTTGPHSSSLANKADPRVDSDRDGSRNYGAAQYSAGSGANTYGSGPTHTTGAGGYNESGLPGQAPNTAGPHKSDLLNKADPRVDSDLDGSRTVGGNATYNASSSSGGPPDAATHTPTEFRRRSGSFADSGSDFHSRHGGRRGSLVEAEKAYGPGHR